MSFGMAQLVLDDAQEIGANSLKFNYRGESTMNPDFRSIAEYAKKLSCGSVFMDRVLNSNFKFHHDREDIFDGLCDMTKVKVSYDSLNKSVFEKQRSGGDWEKTTKNIDLFYNHKKRKNTELVIQAVRTQLNEHEDLESEIKKKWPSVTVSIRNVVDGRKRNKIDDMLVKRRDFSSRQACLQAFVRLIVHHDGEVVPCCPSIDSSLSIGNVNNESLYNIFNSDKAKTLRKDLKDLSAFGKYKSCINCPSHESFRGYKHPWSS